MQVTIDHELLNFAPDLTLGVVTADVAVQPSSSKLWAEVTAQTRDIARQVNIAEISKRPAIQALRALYRALGRDANRYRGSAEALMRRLAQGRALYRINNVVEINNLVSVESEHAVGSYDVSKLEGDVLFRRGLEQQSYEAIGKGELQLSGLPVFVDGQGPFGSPTSDSVRTCVTAATERMALVIISCNGSDGLGKHMSRAASLLQEYADGKSIKQELVRDGS